MSSRTDGEPVLQGYLLDVTARREAEEQLRHQAFHDALTGLANRALFTNRVEHALVLRKQGTRGVAVLFLDLDDFKAVNDSLGHVAGDALLRGVGARLRDALSPSHTVARLGGDEFADPHRGGRGRRDGRRRRGAPRGGPAGAVRRRGSRGLRHARASGSRWGRWRTSCFDRADVAMYRAKASGKAQYVVYAPNMGEELVGRLELVAELRRARCDEEFVAPLPARRRPRERSRRRSRGARSLGASDPRPHSSRRVHPARGGDRQDRGARPLGAPRGVPQVAALALRDIPAPRRSR